MIYRDDPVGGEVARPDRDRTAGPLPDPDPSATGLARFYGRIGPGGSLRKPLLAVIALVSAAPTLVWAFTGAAFLNDDWYLSASFAHGDLASRLSELWQSVTVAPARPGSAVYYLLSYGLFGTNAMLHAVLLAVVNAVLGVLIFLVAERLWGSGIAFWVAATYVVLPNRGSTRVWFAVATYPLAIVFVLLGVLVILRGRTIVASLLLALGVLTYEGVLGLAALAVVGWVFVDLRARWRRGLLASVPVLLAAAFVYLRSPKRGGEVRLFGGFDTMVASQFGVGTFHWPTLTQVALPAFLILVVVMIGLRRPADARYRRAMLWGLLIFLAGWGPYFLIHWPIATDGFFDRANGVVGVGTAVLFGVVLAWLADSLPLRLGVAAAGVLLVVLLGLNAVDLHDVRRAVHDGNDLLANVLVDVPPTTETIRIIPPPDGSGGYTQFPSGTDLNHAVFFARGDHVDFYSVPASEERPLPDHHLCYDRNTRVVEACPDGY